MRIHAAISDLLAAFKTVKRGIPRSGTMPILEQALCLIEDDTVYLRGTDLTTTVTTPIPNASIGGGGEGQTLPVGQFAKTLRSLSANEQATLIFDAIEQIVTLEVPHRDASYQAASYPGEDFPNVASIDDEHFAFTVEPDVLQHMLAKVAPFVSNDPLRPAMEGVLMQAFPDELRLVATDGHQLSWLTETGDVYADPPGAWPLEDMGHNAPDDPQLIVMGDAADLVQKLEGAIRVVTNGSHVAFHSDAETVTARLIDEAYPNYKSVVPNLESLDTVLRCETRTLRDAVERTSLFCSSHSRTMVMKVQESRLLLEGDDVESSAQAHEQVAAERLNGEDLTIGFNADYLADTLKPIETGEVCLRFESPKRAVTIEPAPQGQNPAARTTRAPHTLLLMPVMLNSYA